MQVKAPRMLFLHWPFGHALGEPHNRAQQETVLHDVFSMAQLAPYAGLVVDLPYQWRRQIYEPITEWTSPSEALSQGLARALKEQEEVTATGSNAQKGDTIR